MLTPKGQWIKPVLLGVLDDHSRLSCHAQWYWTQTAEDLVHGLSQAFCQWGLPRALMTDNGSAMQAAEFIQGLGRLSIVHDPTLPYSAYQNGKQEVFWGTVEGRLMAMLEDVEELTLPLLNEATCAWVQMEYNRTKHSETHEKPLDRFINGPQASRPGPSSEDLRLAFRQDAQRTQRRTDGTVSLEGVRFEIPSRFRHVRRVAVRYARWNLRCVHLVDERTDTLLAPIYPVDKARNANAKRRVLEPDLLSSASDRLGALPEVAVGVLTRPQSRMADFYRELGEIFSVQLSPQNRWGGFKALRERWKAHVESSLLRPVLLIDEAQEMVPEVLSELRLLASANFDSTSYLTAVLCGDGRLVELFRHTDLVPLGSRIRTRLGAGHPSRPGAR